ncbi:DNA mismatch repair endonuclease MutL [Bacillus sp. FJAT-47783]|uniref:DNA mismatch repair endonuclease MutL n=1 Tax=Bacillus sp. FJAT-47783 TaxID=2922712 RepID=UPI001FAD7555|nr:DNA mismatch repair endonuclease MutL [Bacillus sp. FJAT-47783]
MGKIIRLDDQLSNKIAAGEVVERPASVVKELVENAIDANATVIEIEVEEAGLSKIRIIDNGDGIERDDCLNAFHRHATSKIKDENDLFRIRTLGFRGEALPSIASVSHLEMKTSTGDGPGTRLVLNGGIVETEEPFASRKGTDITVTHLFFNTPARLKYMKTVHTELGNISDVVNRLALAHPDISMKLSHNGKRLLYTNGQGDVRHVIAAIYGMAVAKKMVPLHLSSLDFEVKGFISYPEVTRASRNYISTILNGRYVKNFPLVKALLDGYHTLLPIGRYPIALLQITMDPILVDVNVHPSKLEVRISKEAELYELLSNGVKNVFIEKQLIPEVKVASPKKKEESEQQKLEFHHDVMKEQKVFPAQELKIEKKSYIEPKEEKPPYEKQELRQGGEREGIASSVIYEQLEEEEVKDDSFIESATESEMVYAKEDSPPEKEEKESRVPTMYPIGQMHGTYILAQNEKGLYIIDQHAAQERIKYEYYREKVGEVADEVQELLVPMTFTYSTDEALIIDAHLEELKKVGVFLEEFGRNSYIVRSHPTWFPKGKEQEVIEEIIQQVLDDKRVSIKKLREEAAIMMSCKGSIKANHHLRHDEIFALLESLRHSSDPFTCPHGRPIIIHYSTYEMEKMFKRVM